MEPLIGVLRANEDDILARVFALAQRHGYTRYSSTLMEAWRASVRGLTEALVAGLERGAELEAGVDAELSDDPVTRFGRESALRHRSRGVTLPMFLGLTKDYRDAFADSGSAGAGDAEEQARRQRVLVHLFDRIEVGFCDAWARADASSGVAELQAANRALANEKNRYLTVLESMLEAVLVVGARGEVVYANRAALVVTGRASEPGAARYGGALADLNAHRPPWLAGLLAGDGARTAEVAVPGVETTRTFVAQVTPILDITARTEGVVVVLRDLTQLRAADRERRELTAVFDAVTRCAGDGIVMLDVQGRVLFWNRAAETMFGWQRHEVLGRDLHTLLGQEGEVPRAHRGLERWRHEGTGFAFGRNLSFECRRRDGTPLSIELAVSEVRSEDGRRALGIVRDVTERRRIDAQAHASARLEAVGRLAGGIAHEINTPVQFVGDSLYFLRDATRVLCTLGQELEARAATLPDEVRADPWFAQLEQRLRELDVGFLFEEAPKALERAVEGVGRVADIVRAMKEFGHPGTGRMAAADLNRAVRNTLLVSRPSWKYVATASFEEGPLPMVVCHVEQISQVLLNLVVNAADAIRERRDQGTLGQITVRSRVEGPDAVLEVEDSGVGIPPAAQAHLFQPFFTTKEPGLGTGQGLALSRHIVTDTHQGTLDFRTTPGKGTTFTVRLPVLRPARAGRPPDPAEPEVAA
jgi:two-component system, NtrC family, sensor kinase